MQQRSPSTGRWADGRLDALRQEADPEADGVVAGLLAGRSAGDPDPVSPLFRQLITHRAALPPGVPPAVAAYFAETAALPSWADPVRIRQGEEFFCEHGPEMMMLLYYKALPECYACWRGAEVLYRTGQMTEHHGSTSGLGRRLVETAQFVLDVMAPGGLSEGHGVQSIQKVRLIHAAIRTFIRRGAWDARERGAPINQEDLAGTLMSFSVALLDGLRTLGIPVTPAQEESYLHCWKVVGALLGIRPELLPEDMADARALTAAILRRQVGPSEGGRALARALIDFIDQQVPVPVFRSMPSYLIRYCTDAAVAQALDVHARSSLAGRAVLAVVHGLCRAVDRVSGRSRLVAGLFGRLSYGLMQRLLVLYNHGKQVPFEVHPELCARWGLPQPVPA